jgi:hypothetical protein
LAERAPAVAIAALRRVVQTPGVLIEPAHLAEDLANLRLAYTEDAGFAAAIGAVAGAIQTALAQREQFGTRLEYGLKRYYRAKFQAERKPKVAADLRLVFRPIPQTNQIEIIAFGHRFNPQSVYLGTGARIKP